MESKQVIVIRKDLEMTLGKTIAQGAHASLQAFKEADRIQEAVQHWENGIYRKICVTVDSEEKLIAIYEKAKKAEIPCALITDMGLTKFNGIETKTAVGIGPAWDKDIDPITKRLRLI